MKNELIVLGTGHAMVTKCYNTCFVIKNEYGTLLVDGGGGNQIFNQLEKANIDISEINDIFVSHSHTDHVLGIVWVVRKIASLINSNNYRHKLNIYACKEVISDIIVMCEIMLPKKLTTLFNSKIMFNPIDNTSQAIINNMNFSFFNLLSKKQVQYGFISSFNGIEFCFAGDEPLNSELYKLVQNSDYLMHEAYCLDADKDIFKPYEKAHSTALDAGRIAKETNVKNLILYHTEDSNLKFRQQLYKEEASIHFNGNIYVPNDLDVIKL
ncbi:MAG: MBL fold metallo-hydrolase [Anaeroplasmataceae bacterium]